MNDPKPLPFNDSELDQLRHVHRDCATIQEGGCVTHRLLATLDAERARPDALREDSVWTTDVNGDPVNLIAHIVKAHGIDLADSGCSYCAKAAALAGKEPTDG